MNIFKRLISRPTLPTIDINPQESILETQHLDLEKLNHSFEELRRATSSVTEAATEAAMTLHGQLQDAEYRFYSTIDSIDDFVIIKDEMGCWKTVNKAGQQLFGWIHGEYIGKTNEELAMAYPLFKNVLLKCSRSDELVWMNKKPYREEACLPYDGGYKCFDIVRTPTYDERDRKKELIMIGRDVTEHIERQRRMKASFIALNSISDLIVILDHAGCIYFCNDIFINKMDISSYESVIGKHICDLLTIEGFDDVWEVVSHNARWDGACVTEDSLDEKEHELHVVPMMNGHPYPIYYICTIRPKKENKDGHNS